jgi:hypothetical protein
MYRQLSPFTSFISLKTIVVSLAVITMLFLLFGCNGGGGDGNGSKDDIPDINIEPVETYPLADPSKKSNLYRVEVFKDNTWIDANTYQYARKSITTVWHFDGYPTVHWTTIGIAENIQLKVKVTRLNRPLNNDPFWSVELLPSRYNKMPLWDRDVIEFTIEQNQKVYVRTNDQDYDVLFINATPPRLPIPKTSIKYFGPGIHNIGVNYKLECQNVYLDGGSWIVGSLNIEKIMSNGPIHIMGPGVLSGEYALWEDVAVLPWDSSYAYDMIHTGIDPPFAVDYIKIEGITIVGSPFFNLQLSNHYERKFIDNVHIISPWTHNTDAFAVGTGGTITNSFAFNADDTIHAEYLWAHDMSVSDCVFAGPWSFLIGYGYLENGSQYQASISNIDLILQERFKTFHAEIDARNSNYITENQAYENINIDGDVNQLIYLAIEDTNWGASNPAQGNIRDILFDNIVVYGEQKERSVIKGIDANNRIDSIHFRNLIIDGTPVTNSNYTQYFEIDPATTSVIFD